MLRSQHAVIGVHPCFILCLSNALELIHAIGIYILAQTVYNSMWQLYILLFFNKVICTRSEY